VTDAGSAGRDAEASIPHLNLELERTRLEFRDTVRAIEDKIDVRARYRRWRANATGADRAFPVAIAAGVAIAAVAVIGIVAAARSRAQ
jgi:hypothetical protein